ncbi:MAG: pilus assembly protein [Alphaproteobacteria bacterium]|nr:pilus assembly protein [Alphaproteobacteria bacterium]
MPDRRGAVAAFVAVGIVPLVGFVGLATDAARGYMVKSKLHQALDSAGLAGGRAMLEPDRDADIVQFFEANFPPGYMGAQVTGPTIDADESEGLLTLTATANVPTSFMQVLGFSDITVSAHTVVHRAVRGMELALIMDNTGSMRSGGKIQAMRDAAHDLVDILYGDDETVNDFWVALVPYAATVNIGGGRTAWLDAWDPADYLPPVWEASTSYTEDEFASYDGLPYQALTDNSGAQPDINPSDWQALAPITWKGCVEARPAPFDQNDALPSAQAFVHQYWSSTLGVYTPSTGDNDWDWANIDESNGAQNNGLGPNLGCGPAITPLSASKTVVKDAIDLMEPWHRGGTMANLGLAWGWRVLSPTWQGLWGGATPAELPLDYDTPLMDKVAVILTDGVNQWYDWPTGLPNNPDADYTAYGRVSEGRLGTTNGGAATTEINTRLLTVCNAMKSEGIIIFAITFQLNNTTTQDLYRSCATSPAHYFNSPSNDDLQDVFHEIGNELTNLRLAQ